MSRGLQTSTEIRPATIPETKLMSFWWGCWRGGAAVLVSMVIWSQLINIIIIGCTTPSGWAVAWDYLPEWLLLKFSGGLRLRVPLIEFSSPGPHSADHWCGFVFLLAGCGETIGSGGAFEEGRSWPLEQAAQKGWKSLWSLIVQTMLAVLITINRSQHKNECIRLIRSCTVGNNRKSMALWCPRKWGLPPTSWSSSSLPSAREGPAAFFSAIPAWFQWVVYPLEWSNSLWG